MKVEKKITQLSFNQMKSFHLQMSNQSKCKNLYPDQLNKCYSKEK